MSIVRHERAGVITVSRWIFNTHVVLDAGSGRPLVVDAGLPSTGRAAVEELRRSHGAPAPDFAPVVAATHTHSDHVGGVETVLAGRGGEVHLPERSAAYAEGATALTPGPAQVAKALPCFCDQGFSLGALVEAGRSASSAGYGQASYRMPIEPNGLLVDRSEIPGCSGWFALRTPGHTEDSTCFHHPATATLLSGDAILTSGGRAWFNPELTDPAASAETEERLRELEIEHLYPGHGLPLHGRDLLTNARPHSQPPDGARLSERIARRFGDWDNRRPPKRLAPRS